MNKAIIFDRDGTLNIDRDGYTHDPKKLEWIEGALDALLYCHQRGFLILVITNQSGIGRGYYSTADMQQFHNAMNSQCAPLGFQITQFYHCPHKPDDQCECRKPKNALLEQAINEHQLQRDNCFFIGDKETDYQCALASGIAFAYYRQGSLCDVVQKLI